MPTQFIGPFGWAFWFSGGVGPGFGPSYFTVSVDDAAGDWADVSVDFA